MASKHTERQDEVTRTEKKWPGYCKTFIVKDSNGTVKELVFPKALDLDRPKRDRTTFSSRQLTRLEEEFNTNQYIVGKDRTTLAKCLGLSETQVKVWFQNRRTKLKKDNGRNYEGSNSQAESKAARNVLKLLAYQTSVSFPRLQNQLPVGHDPSAETPLSPKVSKLLTSVHTPHTSPHTETRNDNPWSSIEVTTNPTTPSIYACSPKNPSKCLPDVHLQLESRKRSDVFRPASSPVFHKQHRVIEMVRSKHDADVELTSRPANCHNTTQSDDDENSTLTYGRGVGSTHFPTREFHVVDEDMFAGRSERGSSSGTCFVNDSFNQDNNSLLADNKLEQATAQMIKTSTRETHGCVPLHTVPPHRVQVASWVQGNQSQFVSGHPLLPWYDNGTLMPTSYSRTGDPTFHNLYGNMGSPNLTSTKFDQHTYTHYSNYGQQTPNLYPDSSGGTTSFYPKRVSDHPPFGSAILDPNKYREGFGMPYYCPSVGINESMTKAIDVNLNKHIGFKLCTLQPPLFGTMGNEHMLNQIQTQFPYSYFNQS